MKWKWPGRLLAGVAIAAAVTGCAEEREPINRVQAMALPKAFFVGEDLASTDDDPEFYSQAFIIDVPYGAGGDLLWTVGFGGTMSRVRFEINQDYLVARISYERIDDSDGHGVHPAKRDGVIAGVWRIQSHFDIRRSYNPQTGEEMNVIEENMSDRPWYAREYFRVDWSQNLNTDSYDFDTLSWIGMLGPYRYEPLAYEVNDPAHPHAPHFSTEDGYFDVVHKAFAAPQMIDISHMGWGLAEIPACWLENDFFGGDFPAGSCNPVEITIRQSFLRIEDTDYEPAHWDGRKFAAYGAFYTDRFGYSNEYQMRDDKWRRFINRFNIWERSHYYDDPVSMTGPIACNTEATTPFGADPHRDDGRWVDGAWVAEPNGTEDECERVTELTGVSGSRCDEFTNKCTLPYRLRQPKTLAWYFTIPETQDRYFEPTKWAVDEWDAALRSAVLTARYAECRRTGEKKEDCWAQFPVLTGQQQDNMDLVALSRDIDTCRKLNGYADQGQHGDCIALGDQLAAERQYHPGVVGTARMPEMVTLCHSPVLEEDHPVCGKVGTVARLGDSRYHGINVIPQPQTPSPWGIMVSSIDPKTGEEIMLSANVFAWVTDYVAQRTVDYLRYIKGELTTEDVTNAEYVKDWVQAEKIARTGGGGIMPQFTKHDVAERLASVTNAEVDTVLNLMETKDQFRKSKIYQDTRHVHNIMHDIEAHVEDVGAQKAVVSARLRSAAGTPFEAELISPPILQRAGMGGMTVTEEALDLVSPLRLNNPQHELELERMKQIALARRNMCVIKADAAAPEGTSMAAMADMLWDDKFSLTRLDNEVPGFQDLPMETKLYQRSEMVQEFLARKMHFSVITHEIGHAIGHRHNFVGSSDAFIYRPQYWQLRTKNGKVTEECNELTNDGENCIGPRFYDPITPEEDRQLLHMFSHGSIMEYPGNIEADLNGLGVWDFAATRMFYGETVAVFEDEDLKLGTPKGGGIIGKMDNFGGIVGIQPGTVEDGALVDFHYSQWENKYNLLGECYTVEDPYKHRPSTWNDAIDGPWHPLMDGMMVQVDGQWTKCREKQVDYVFWTQLRTPENWDIPEGVPEHPYYRGGPCIDPENRLRVPYGFATDSWADIGNLSVYRHDLGADPYELFQYFISQQELGHIWNNYRRGRQGFSVRGASGGTYGRYNAKMRDAAKGLGLYATLLRTAAAESGVRWEDYVNFYMVQVFPINALASSMAFDHFTRQYQRPHIGSHTRNTSSKNYDGFYYWYAVDDATGNPTGQQMIIPNGTAGSKYRNDVTIGGRLVNNSLADDQGEYDRDFTMNAGSYYDKIYTPMLLCESVDNFISSSRNDFVDPRYRSVSLADLFPDGFRRFMANMLTDDEFIKGIRLAADENGNVTLEDEQVFDPITREWGRYPAAPLIWTSWWPSEGPQSCVPSDGTWACMSPIDTPGINPNPNTPEGFAVLDAQVGWEQQKHLIANTLLYLPENQQQWWLEQMLIYERGKDTDPGFEYYIQFTNPESGRTYLAKTIGKEEIFGKTVQKGIAARVLEFANNLVEAGYKTYQPGDTLPDGVELAPDLDNDGEPDWPTVVRHPDGTPVRLSTAQSITDPESGAGAAIPDCDQNVNPSCEQVSCTSSRRCIELTQYVEIIFFLRQAVTAYGLADLSWKGVYD
ncbi:MAG: hypothetical protein ACOC1F_00050 [Myxococcota bacterium]